MIKPAGILSKIVRNGQLTIPSKMRKSLHIKDGDLIRIDLEDNKLILTPTSTIDKDQSYFSSNKWQEAIKESETAVTKGKFSKYSSAKALKKDIEND